MAEEKKSKTAPAETASAETASAETAGPIPGSEEWLQEKVQVELFRDDGKYTDDVFVGVNGKTFQIKRGVPVMVPRYVAEVLKNSQQQRKQAAMNTDKLQADFERSSKERGINI